MTNSNLTPNDLAAQQSTLHAVPQSPAISSTTSGQHQDYQPIGEKCCVGANLK